MFHHIAQVDFSIRVIDTQISEKEVLDYWSYCVKELDGISPMLLSLLNGQVPKLKGNKLTIQARNDTEARTLKQKYGEIISTIYQNLGFPLMMIESEIGQNESNEEYKKFIEAKQKEDEERAKLAVMEMQKKDAEPNDAGAPEGPVMIGLTIKDDDTFRRMEEIVDEERRITIEGYVFFAETKELRSGRTLLTFKITDYTSSILVKVFSRDKEDAQILNQVKKGMWLRARGVFKTIHSFVTWS